MAAPKRTKSAEGMDTHAAAAQELGDADRPEAAGDLVPGSADEYLDGLLPLGISPLAKRVRGRPEGSQNRRTAVMADYIVKRYGDPFEASAAIGGVSLREAVRMLREIASDFGMKLGASIMEIARFQQECRRDVLPYVHAKRAAEDQRGDTVTPVMVFGAFEAVEKAAGGRSIEDVEYQEVKPGSAEQSHDKQSHDEPSD